VIVAPFVLFVATGLQ